MAPNRLKENEQEKTPSPIHPPGLHEAAAQPSGPRGDNPSTAGLGHTGVRSHTPENAADHINPSAPEDTNTTPGTAAKKWHLPLATERSPSAP